MEKYNQQRCSCGQPAPYEMDRTCGYNSKMKRMVITVTTMTAWIPWHSQWHMCRGSIGIRSIVLKRDWHAVPFSRNLTNHFMGKRGADDE